MVKTRIRILRLLARNGPLTPKRISDELELNPNTVRPHLSYLKNKNGLVQHYRDISGFYEITEKGREHLKEYEGNV